MTPGINPLAADRFAGVAVGMWFSALALILVDAASLPVEMSLATSFGLGGVFALLAEYLGRGRTS